MNFLSINDLSRDQMNEIFEIADEISMGKSRISVREGAVLALLFEQNSTRTRVSFEVAMARLGGRSIYIDAKTTQMSRGEPISDTAKMLSLYVDFVAARMQRHDDLLEFAENSTIPVINAMTDLEHPTQALADLYTITNAKRRMRGLRIACTGDVARNTVNSLMLAATKMGAEVALIGPRDLAPNPEYLTRAKEYGIVDIYDTMEEGLSGADVIYTDAFVSAGNESDAEKRKKMFANYQVNSQTLQYAGKDVLVMHPLPAFRGQEITAEVLDGSRSIVWEQSRNSLLLNQAILTYISERSM